MRVPSFLQLFIVYVPSRKSVKRVYPAACCCLGEDSPHRIQVGLGVGNGLYCRTGITLSISIKFGVPRPVTCGHLGHPMSKVK